MVKFDSVKSLYRTVSCAGTGAVAGTVTVTLTICGAGDGVTITVTFSMCGDGAGPGTDIGCVLVHPEKITIATRRTQQGTTELFLIIEPTIF
jgi:hypothetical protein